MLLQQFLRVLVCTVGPDTSSRVKLTNSDSSDNSQFCFGTGDITPAQTVNIGTINVPDQRSQGSQWNIYAVALDSWEFISRTLGTPNFDIIVVWNVGYTPYSPAQNSTVSYYFFGRVYLNGSSANGDQWNDAVIAHEIGHLVMDKYVGFPPNIYSYHGYCNDGQPGLEYSEGWANFFSSISRSQALHPDDRLNASFYTDAPDNELAAIGTRPSSTIFAENLGYSGRLYYGETYEFRQGNFCEWQIAGALWDISRAPLNRSFLRYCYSLPHAI